MTKTPKKPAKKGNITQQQIMKLIDSVVNLSIKGNGPLASAEELANEYIFDENLKTKKDKIDSLIRWQTARNFGTGFLTGIGGYITLPIALPSALFANYYIQARLVASIAIIHGHKIESDRVKTMILLCLIGNSGKDILKDVGLNVSNKISKNMIDKIPGKMLIEINKKIGFRMFTKAGEKGIINFTRILPVVGGVVSGSIDAGACRVVGRYADNMFKQDDDPIETSVVQKKIK